MRPTPALLLLTLMAMLSCRQPQSTPTPDPIQYSVPVEVEPYVQHFRDELQKRGKTIATNNLIIAFDLPQSTDICGQCILEAGKTPRILLSTDAYCWKNTSDNEKECLVFHELGHCLLNRIHRADRFPNQAYVSLMNPDDRAIYATCVYPIGNDVCDKRDRRTYYLDELVDANAPSPVWAK